MTVASAPAVTALVDTKAPTKRRWDRVFKLVMYTCIAFALVTLVALLVFVVVEGWDRLGWSTISKQPSARPARAGFQSALFGSVFIVFLTAVVTLPLGVGTAVYLEEFAHHDRWYNRLIDLTIQNLAGVPSIVFGVLALGFIAREGAFGLGLGWGFTVGTAALTLTLVVLPTVIIASREAIRAVPPSLRQGALALGATQWQAVHKQVLPAAVPGIATGSILAVSRALGESAPLLLIGGVTFLTRNPDGLDSAFTVMPLMIYTYIADSRAGFRTLAAAGIVVLLVVLLAMNSAAILIRNRFQKKW